MIKSPPLPGQIKLVALDLDNTLLRRDKGIGERSISALKQAHQRGIQICLNSGRMTAAMESTAERLGLDAFILSYNGAQAAGLKKQGRPILYEKTLPRDVAKELLALAHQRHLHFNFYFGDVILCEKRPELLPFLELYVRRTGSPFRFVERVADFLDYPTPKFIFVTPPTLREQLFDELLPIFQGRANLIKTDPEYLEFTHPKVNKGSGLRGLCAALELGLERVMALGDGENDIPALEVAGWGVAVANALPSLKAIAGGVTLADCDHDAVAEALERWIP